VHFSQSRALEKLALSGEVNRMIAAAINANPRWFWESRMCKPDGTPYLAIGHRGDERKVGRTMTGCRHDAED
jgi:hypothetical protein